MKISKSTIFTYLFYVALIYSFFYKNIYIDRFIFLGTFYYFIIFLLLCIFEIYFIIDKINIDAKMKKTDIEKMLQSFYSKKFKFSQIISYMIILFSAVFLNRMILAALMLLNNMLIKHIVKSIIEKKKQEIEYDN